MAMKNYLAQGIVLLLLGCVAKAAPVDEVALLAQWRTWQKTEQGEYKPSGLYQDLACKKPATAAGDVVMAVKDERNPSGLVLRQEDPQKCATLQFEGGRPVLRFDGVDDNYLVDMKLPLDGLDVWIRYKLKGIVKNTYAAMVSGSDKVHPDYVENGFRIFTMGYKRSTGQNVMQVDHLHAEGNAETLFVEGVPISTGKFNTGTAEQLCVGSGLAPVAKNFVPMDLEAVYVGSHVPPDQYAGVDRALGAKPDAPRLVCVGDSITDGSHGSQGIWPTEEYPSQLQLLRPDRFVINSGKWGAIIGTVWPVDPLFSPNAQLVVFIGSNDVSGGSPADKIFKNLANYCQAQQKKGWKVYVCTLLPRSFPNGKDAPTDFYERRNAVNTNIRARYKEFADGLIDLAADSRIGDDGDEKDLTYFLPDQVHPTAKGAEVLAELVNKGLPKP